MTPFVQKLTWTVLAIGTYALATVPVLSGAREALNFLAGLIVGAVWVVRPGDAKPLELGREVIRRSIPPIALVLLLTLAACATIKGALRTVSDIAHDLCSLVAAEQSEGARDGLTVEQWCAIEENVKPFLDEVLAAKQAAASKAGLTSGGEAKP